MHTVVHRVTDAVIGQKTIFEGLLVPGLVDIEELFRLVDAFATLRGVVERTFEEPTLLIELVSLFQELLLLVSCVCAIAHQGVVPDICRWDVQLDIAVAKFPDDEADDSMHVLNWEALEDRRNAHKRQSHLGESTS
jgi:hypothetical protein